MGDVLSIAAFHDAHHVPKMDFFEVDPCYVMNDHRMVNALLRIARTVVGYERMTFDPHTGRIGRPHTYTRPFVLPKDYRSSNDGSGNYKKG